MEFIKDGEEVDHDFLFKFMFLGASNIGKTLFLYRIALQNDFSNFINLKEEVKSNVGVELRSLKIKYKNKIIKLQLWDSPGAEGYQRFTLACARGCKAFLLFYDSYERDSFDYIKKKYYELKNEYNNSVFVFIRNKYDKKIKKNNKKFVPDEEVLEFTDNNEIIFVHISSFEKYNSGIKKLFELIFDKLIENGLFK